MLKAVRVVLPLLILAVVALTLPRWAAPQNDQPLPGVRPRTQFAPYYTVEAGFQAMLMLNNSTRAAFVVRPTVYSLAGNAVPMAPIRLEAHGTQEIDLGPWVARLGDEYVTGSLRLDYVGVGF